MTAIGFHVNSTGGHRGALGEYLSRLDAAGIPFAINAVEDAGLAVEAAGYTNAPHVIVFRKNIWSYAPNYNSGNPDGDAAHRWRNIILPTMPPEIAAVRGKAWLDVLNEPAKEHADYVHRFMLAIAKLAAADGYRVCGPSWSTGTPEVNAWESDAGRAWLRYCGEHPNAAALSLHEYSLEVGDIKNGYPWLIGRFQFILDACDDAGIPRPRILIKEAGWTYDNCPAPEQAMADVAWMASVYGDIPFMLWTLGLWSQGPSLPGKLAQIVEPLTEYMLAHGTPVEPEEPMDIEQWLWEQSKAYQKQKGVDVHPEHGLEAIVEQMIINEPGWVIGHNETTFTAADGTKYGVMAVEHITGKRPRTMLWFKRPWGGPGSVKLVTDPEALLLQAPVGTAEERASGELWD